jgi:hypothetical protein
MTREVNFSELCGFSPKQWTATHTADAHRYTLFGGSRGPGKSYWLRWWLVRFLLRQAAAGRLGVRVMLACEDYPSLYERQVSKMEAEFPSWLGKFKRNDFVLASCYGSGVIACRNLDDPSKYQSSEFAAMAIDEITKNPAKSFDILRGSLRWPGIEDVKLVGACNPEANWVRQYWIEKSFPEGLLGHEDEFAFVPALPQDNPHLDKSYWDMLGTLSGALRQAWLHGDWYAAVEGLVYGNFSADNIVDDEPRADRPYDLAIDDGYIDPRATLFVQRQHNGDLLVFDELYETQMLEEQTIEHIQEKVAAHRLNLARSALVSHEAVALRRRLREAKIPAFNWMEQKVAGGQSTRLAAITLTRSMLCDGKGYRAIKIHRRCKRLIDEISAGYKYPEGKHGLETHPADGNDHSVNALEGYIWAAYGGVSTPRKKATSREN